MLWLIVTFLLLPSLDGHSREKMHPPTTSLPLEWDRSLEGSEYSWASWSTGGRSTPTFRFWTTITPPFPSTYGYPRQAEPIHQTRSAHGYTRDPPTLNSFHDTAYFRLYGLDDREYNAAFLLVSIRTESFKQSTVLKFKM